MTPRKRVGQPDPVLAAKAPTGARAKLRLHFLSNLNRVMDSTELRLMAGGHQRVGAPRA